MIEKGTVIIDLNEYDTLKSELFNLTQENKELNKMICNARSEELALRDAARNIIREEAEKTLEATKSLRWDKEQIKRYSLDILYERYKDFTFAKAFIDSLLDEYVKTREENE